VIDLDLLHVGASGGARQCHTAGVMSILRDPGRLSSRSRDFNNDPCGGLATARP
jgi:hypothetical protein